MDRAASTTARGDAYSQYYGRMCASQICPDLDIAWRRRLAAIFDGMPGEWCEGVYRELLAPAGILWSRKSGEFGRRAEDPGLQDFVETACPAPLLGLAQKCLQNVQAIRETSAALDIATALEDTLAGFDENEPGADTELLLARRTLLDKYIRTAGAIIKTKKDLQPPEGQRKMDGDVARTFLNEVFLKQRLLGHRFLVLRRRQLERLPQPFFRSYLSEQQSVRRLEIVHTTRYIFALAAPADASENAFSARHFFEEEAASAQLTTTSAPFTSGFIRENRTADPGRTTGFMAQVEGIISLSSQVSPNVRDALERMEEHYDLRMRPILFTEPDDTHGVPLKHLLAHSMSQYKDKLETGIFQPLKACVTRECRHPEDFNYLFTGVRQLLGEIISDFASFQSRPLAQSSTGTERMMARLQAYLQLLIKRRSRIFSSDAVLHWSEHSDAAAHPRKMLGEIIRKYGKQSLHARGNVHERGDTTPGALLPRGKSRSTNGLSDAQMEIKKIRRAAHLEIISLLTQWRDEILNLGYEPMRFLTRQRCYAVCAGSNGLDKLPVLAVFPENYNDFDPGAYLQMFMERRRSRAHESTTELPSAFHGTAQIGLH